VDSYLLSLIRGEGGALSARERLLLKFALDVFGEPLSQLILAGLGEEAEARSWLFTVTFENARGATHRREIRLESDEHPGVVTLLPRRREPLVILALLRLLIADRQMASASLSYRQAEVLGLLEWKGAMKSRLILDQAVERYARLSYNWKLSDEELIEGGFAYFHGSARFISGYGHQNHREDRQIKRLVSWVEFNSNFVQGLLGRSLWGINWNSVTTLERASP
jgi:hypothetical protein